MGFKILTCLATKNYKLFALNITKIILILVTSILSFYSYSVLYNNESNGESNGESNDKKYKIFILLNGIFVFISLLGPWLVFNIPITNSNIINNILYYCILIGLMLIKLTFIIGLPITISGMTYYTANTMLNNSDANNANDNNNRYNKKNIISIVLIILTGCVWIYSLYINRNKYFNIFINYNIVRCAVCKKYHL